MKIILFRFFIWLIDFGIYLLNLLFVNVIIEVVDLLIVLGIIDLNWLLFKKMVLRFLLNIFDGKYFLNLLYFRLRNFKDGYESEIFGNELINWLLLILNLYINVSFDKFLGIIL